MGMRLGCAGAVPWLHRIEDKIEKKVGLVFRTLRSGCVIAVALCLAGGTAYGQGWMVSGQVTDGLGLGIGGVDIDIVSDTTGIEVLGISGDTTDVDGSFVVTINEAIPVGNYEIFFTPDVGSPYFVGSTVVFLAGSAPIGITALDPGQFLTGRVVDDLGVGLEEVDIDATDSGGTPADLTGDVTDEFGMFEVLVPVGTYDIKIAETPLTIGGPYVPKLFPAVAFTAPIDLGDVTLRNGYPLTGVVQSTTGTPIVDADVDVTDPITGERILTPGDNTDSLGQFAVLVPAGEWLVEVDPPVGAILVPVESTVNVTSLGTDMGIVTLVPGFQVFGRTVDMAISPVSDVDLDFVISASGVEIPTAHDNADDLGLFSVVVPANTYDVVFRPPFDSGHAPLIVPDVVVGASTDLGDVILPLGFAVSGVVTFNSAPVAGVSISMVDSATLQPLPVFGSSTGLLGEYAFRQVPGTYDITFTPPITTGLAPVTEAGVVLSADVVLNVALGVVVPTGFIRGDANDDGGVNLADAIRILEVLFAGGGPLTCNDAGDANDDGGVDISDPIFLLAYLFTMGPSPSLPFPTAGPDPTPDALTCP